MDKPVLLLHHQPRIKSFSFLNLRSLLLYLGPVRVSQLLAGISCIAAIVVLVRQYNRIKVEKAFYAPEQDKADEKKGE